MRDRVPRHVPSWLIGSVSNFRDEADWPRGRLLPYPLDYPGGAHPPREEADRRAVSAAKAKSKLAQSELSQSELPMQTNELTITVSSVRRWCQEVGFDKELADAAFDLTQARCVCQGSRHTWSGIVRVLIPMRSLRAPQATRHPAKTTTGCAPVSHQLRRDNRTQAHPEGLTRLEVEYIARAGTPS